MAKKEKTDGKTCFVISPIGEEGSDIRHRADQVLTHIIRPAAEECGYSTIRADEISEPGIITSQVIQHLIEDPLVIADLTGRNPNVYYELAVRHAVKKPVVQIVQSGESIPFDVAATRTIPVDHRDLDSAAQCRVELARQIHSVELDPTQVDSPISVAIDLQTLRHSGNPLEKSTADIIAMLQDVRGAIREIGDSPRRARIHPAMLEELFQFYARVVEAVEPEEGGTISQERLDEVRHLFRRFESFLEMLAMESGMPRHMFMEFRERFRSKRPKPR